MKEIHLYGADWCPYCHTARQYLDAQGAKYTYHDVDEEGRDGMHAHLPDNETIPVVVFGNTAYVNPSQQEMKKELDAMAETTETTDTKTHDVVMIGAGPASLSAAIYTTRENMDTVLLEKGVIGGLAAITDWVDNYPGFEKGLAGLELAESLQKQAERFGAKIELDEVTGIEEDGDERVVKTISGEYRAKAVLIATGSDWKKIGVPGEQEFYGRGVHYCATCDGAFYQDKRLVVVGGGNSAVQEAIFLTKFATHIDMLVRSDEFRASEVLVDELAKHKDKITVHMNTTTDEIIGKDGKVASVKGTDKAKGEPVEFETDGVFIFVGLKPNTQFLKDTAIELDDVGLIKTDANLQTSMTGVFAAGDVRSGATMQIASATGEGATAALMIRKYLEPHHQ